MKTTTKDKILELIKRKANMTVNDLTESLNITHMAVRKHLAVLEKEELIQSYEVKQPLGRPLLVYSLTDKGEHIFPKNYEGITIEFLEDIEELHGRQAIEQLFQKRKRRLAEEFASRLAHKEPTEKIEEIVHIQNEKGYMTDLTKVEQNIFEMTEYNCPILSVANKYPIACECETELFENVLQTTKVTRVCCQTDGSSRCTFRFEF